MDVSPMSDASTVARHTDGTDAPPEAGCALEDSGASLSQQTLLSFRNFLRAYRYWLPPTLLAVGLAFFFLSPFIGDWDGLEYTVYSLHGEPSSMALGRSLFTLFNHSLYTVAHVLFGVKPER